MNSLPPSASPLSPIITISESYSTLAPTKHLQPLRFARTTTDLSNGRDAVDTAEADQRQAYAGYLEHAYDEGFQDGFRLRQAQDKQGQ
jgi:hypothetical protein